MNRRWLVTIAAAFGVAVVGLATALTIVIATDDDPDSASPLTTATYSNCGMGWGMVPGRGDWNPESMRSYMASTLGKEGYKQMVDCMRAYSNGQDVSGYSVDGPMWQVMTSMMRGWPAGDMERCWGWMTR